MFEGMLRSGRGSSLCLFIDTRNGNNDLQPRWGEERSKHAICLHAICMHACMPYAYMHFVHHNKYGVFGIRRYTPSPPNKKSS